MKTEKYSLTKDYDKYRCSDGEFTTVTVRSDFKGNAKELFRKHVCRDCVHRFKSITDKRINSCLTDAEATYLADIRVDFVGSDEEENPVVSEEIEVSDGEHDRVEIKCYRYEKTFTV